MKTRHRTRSLFAFAAVLSFILISSHSWAVYGVPIINLKHAEFLERSGKYLDAAADRELAADFYKFVSIPQFEDDMEYFLSIGEENKARFCRNTISGFEKSMKLCYKKAEENRKKAKATKEQIDKYRKRNRMRMLAGCEVYPLMHNGQMGVDVGALEKNGEIAEDFVKAAEGRKRTARLYEKITIPWVLHEAEVLERDGKVKLAAEFRGKEDIYRQKAENSRQKAAENLQKAEELRKFEDEEYVADALDGDDASIRKLALKKLIRDANYPVLMKAARSAYQDVSQMANEALESNKGLFAAVKADLLVLALSSGNIDVRRTAIDELEALAGTTLGYSPDAEMKDRTAALAQWQEWLTTKMKSGLAGIYYKGKNFEKEIFARADKVIDFEWQNEPHKSLPKDKFSVRWIGKISIPKAGKYTLSVKADDGAKIWIGKIPDLKEIIYDWSEYSYAGNRKEVHLEEGLYDLRIEYYENSKNATMKLYWEPEDGKKQIIPEENLFHVSL
jgi:hypothetical protein